MSKRSKRVQQQIPMTKKAVAAHQPAPPSLQAIHGSLLDEMQDGNEYQSIVSKMPEPGFNLIDDVARAITEIEAVRHRPCLMYVGNVVKKDDTGSSSVDSSDELPFREMVAKVPAEHRNVDIFLATNGGSAQQVSNFVNCLRARFDDVHFLIPSFCMSAGTLFALSGDRIWMTDRACLGPIDPQVPTSSGRYVPAQALLLLVTEIQREGDEAMAKGLPVPWAYVRVIDTLDKKELGEALTASQYSRTMAAQFLQTYKFRNWTVYETRQTLVSASDKEKRALEIANALCAHDRWKSHGHAISRDVLSKELRLRIDFPDTDLNRAMVRLWAILTYVFDKTPMVKVLCSSNYRYARQVQMQIIGPIRSEQA